MSFASLEVLMATCVDSNQSNDAFASVDGFRSSLRPLEPCFPQIARDQWEDIALILAGWDRTQAGARAKTSLASVKRYVAAVARVCRTNGSPDVAPKHPEDG